ncbi:hypothetical protein GGR52DRAFT_573759 [Hypoxylon sp. FL1284]|nr:hypothetical protein GGR52DRAFT_573759 [Hypoxylon sp. FL1284]
MPPRKESQRVKKVVKPKEHKISERAWDHLTYRIPKVEPNPDLAPASRSTHKKSPDEDAKPSRSTHEVDFDGEASDYDDGVKQSAKHTVSDAGTRRMYVSKDDPSVANWYRMWDEEHGQPTSTANAKGNQNSSVYGHQEHKNASQKQVMAPTKGIQPNDDLIDDVPPSQWATKRRKPMDKFQFMDDPEND